MRYTKVKDKPVHRLESLKKKMYLRRHKLEMIVILSSEFVIPLSEVTKSAIEQKKKEYWSWFIKLSTLIKYKKGIIPIKAIEHIEKYWNYREY